MTEELQGLIFNIQKFSVHDGPGIRTTVFFKGCPLNCKWCANPESKDPRNRIAYNHKNCSKCKTCTQVCPNSAIEYTNDRIVINHDKCNFCLNCINNCPPHALYLEGKFYTVDELLKEVMKDEVFFTKSGGGVTLSGGEPTLQKAFIVEFLKRLQELKVHTNMETTGYIDTESFNEIISHLDLIYFDIKHYDSTRHKLYTGVSNKLILNNLEFAVNAGKNIVARIPVIPRFNYSVDDARKFIVLLKKHQIKQVHLLPFHNYALGKYEMMGQEYEYKDDKNLQNADLEEMLSVFLDAGFEARIGG
ncbi:cobalamin-independent glycerol dehydratase small subunit [Alkalibaculum bacchi]|uniref:Cobalamin-independent glycerol dehydratase small subunit n=1 Tax=Alkalibaculum bacchi TaxID=645887 RepID=A0A366I312_9FIRM|nr:glycyl-radical enzyme activating protein [Alkalibaculum bacchi]RBP61339.1 cobalamin-independent glycerol dehydratase small subunit [Alkalibaculum bacchi]